METRANHVWVGIVTLALLAALAVFIVWIAGWGTSDRKKYDIFFPQAVEGLAEGSTVTFAGVPVGKVDDMNLWEKDPQFVQVRISVKDDVPILQGTTATVLGSFTGVSTIQLDGARAGQPPITRMGRDGVPEIQPKAGGLGAILAGAPQLLDNLSTLTERLTDLLDAENQRSIKGILANTDRMTAQLADASPKINQVLTDLDAALAQATSTLAQFDQTLASTNQLLNRDGASTMQELRRTLVSARQAADALNATMADVQPAARQVSSSTLPAAEAALRDLRKTTAALRQMTESIQANGAGSVLGGQKLPDYKP
ncbi:MCE family protein [Altererythrobacter salegens]|uniref:MCE family protein n=1 Tax=Croceibacterium salegens TaxID=1737568 RepID=A0A6I4SUJ3_9SPHN|nr:MlaD family protein [Croceibacterium salegens]MXO58112.1 MCE family protein [Croceibacterium salegens]